MSDLTVPIDALLRRVPMAQLQAPPASDAADTHLPPLLPRPARSSPPYRPTSSSRALRT